MTSVGIPCQQQFSAEKGANSETGARWIRASRLRDRVDELVPEEGYEATYPLSWEICCPVEYTRTCTCTKIADKEFIEVHMHHVTKPYSSTWRNRYELRTTSKGSQVHASVRSREAT